MRKRWTLLVAMSLGRSGLLFGLIGGGLLGGTFGLWLGVIALVWGGAGSDHFSGPPPSMADSPPTAILCTANGAIAGALLVGTLSWAARMLLAPLRGTGAANSEKQ
jgi:hypothetical protein